MRKIFIVLYPDGSMVFFNVPVLQKTFVPGTRFFSTRHTTDICALWEWVEQNYNHPDIKEIK